MGGNWCVAPKRTSGYDSSNEKIYRFSVPKDNERLQLWKQALLTQQCQSIILIYNINQIDNEYICIYNIIILNFRINVHIMNNLIDFIIVD